MPEAGICALMPSRRATCASQLATDPIDDKGNRLGTARIAAGQQGAHVGADAG
jgi:hypothetical protein